MVRWLMRQPDKASLDSDRHHGALRRQAVKATGEWILANKELLDWKDPSSPARFLCMHGMRECYEDQSLSWLLSSH